AEQDKARSVHQVRRPFTAHLTKDAAHSSPALPDRCGLAHRYLSHGAPSWTGGEPSSRAAPPPIMPTDRRTLTGLARQDPPPLLRGVRQGLRRRLLAEDGLPQLRVERVGDLRPFRIGQVG